MTISLLFVTKILHWAMISVDVGIKLKELEVRYKIGRGLTTSFFYLFAEEKTSRNFLHLRGTGFYVLQLVLQPTF